MKFPWFYLFSFLAAFNTWSGTGNVYLAMAVLAALLALKEKVE